MQVNLSKIAVSALLAAVVAVAGFSVPRPAQAQWVVTDPGHTVQTIVAEAQRALDAANDYANQAAQLQSQLQQYQNMVQQGLSLPDQVWSSVTGDMQQLVSVYQGSKALAHSMSDLDDRFRQQFQGFDSYLEQIDAGTYDMHDRYRKWSEQGFDNARYALKAAGMQAGMFEGEDTIMQRLVQRSQSAEGRMQAIQVGNEIAAQQVQQMQKLRELMASQITMQANWYAQQTDQAAHSAAALRHLSGDVPSADETGFSAAD